MKADWIPCALAPLAAGLSGEPEEVAALDPVQPAMIPVAGLGPATHVFGAELSLPQGVDARDKPGQGAFGGKLGANRPHELPSTFPGQPCACGERVGVRGVFATARARRSDRRRLAPHPEPACARLPTSPRRRGEV